MRIRREGGELLRFGSVVVASLYHPYLYKWGELIIEPTPEDGGVGYVLQYGWISGA